jgi:pimeloyl-ACP methyl ester carboxylesterase
MFEPLLVRLSYRCHLVAPDYPGFGKSDWPGPKRFDYTFDHIASVIDDFTHALGLSHYVPYVQDYGGPVGFRMALAHPERVQALIVQNAVAHNEGLGAIWATRRAFWADRSAHEKALRDNLLSFATTKSRHIGADPKIDLDDPDLWTDEYRFLTGQSQIQTDLFYDYHTNVAAYPDWQAWLRKTQPSFWSSAASMIPRSISGSRSASAWTCRTRRFMYATRDTSRLIPRPMRLQRC